MSALSSQQPGTSSATRNSPDISESQKSKQLPRFLKVLPTPKLRRVPFVVILVFLLVVGVVGLLILNVNLQKQAFQLSDLRDQNSRLSYRESEQQTQLTKDGSVQDLRVDANQYGMKPGDNIGILVLPDGKIVGNPEPLPGTVQADGNVSTTNSDPELIKQIQSAAQQRIDKEKRERQQRKEELQKQQTAVSEDGQG